MEKAKIPDEGKKIKCPKCTRVFIVKKPKETTKEITKETTSTPKPASVQQISKKPEPREKVVQATKQPSVAKPQPKEEPVPVKEEKKGYIPLKDRPRPVTSRDLFETMHERFIPEKAQGFDATIAYSITGDSGDKGGDWTVRVVDQKCVVKEGVDSNAPTKVSVKAKDYMKIAAGKMDARVAFMLGKIKIKGDKTPLAGFRELFRKPEI
jgi:putative sterol carrier protein